MDSQLDQPDIPTGALLFARVFGAESAEMAEALDIQQDELEHASQLSDDERE